MGLVVQRAWAVEFAKHFAQISKGGRCLAAMSGPRQVLQPLRYFLTESGCRIRSGVL